VDFMKFQAVISVESGSSIYADAVNHCRNYQNYVSRGDKITSVHECTHGINADLRNGAIQANMNVLRQGLQHRCSLPLPLVKATDFNSVGTKSNAFYALKDRAIKIPEPDTRKSDCIQYIPTSMHYGRYNLYVAGQKEWDDTPLYLFDEWVAYTNGAECCVELIKNSEYSGGSSDWFFGPIEFVTYCVATLMAARAKSTLDESLKWFSKWNMQRSFELYFIGKIALPWDDMDKCYNQLLSGEECASMRAFLKTELDFVIPTGLPTPPEPSIIDWIM
jgi:hypothetical protein